MRVAVVEFAGRGGLVHYAYQLCRAMAEEGADVTLVTDRHYEFAHVRHSFRVERLLRLWDPKPPGESHGGSRALRRVRRAWRAVRWYREWVRLVRWLVRERFDVVQFGDLRFAGDLVPLALLRLAGVRMADVCHNVQPFAVSGAVAGTFSASALERLAFRAIYRLFDHVFVHFEVNRARFLRTFAVDPRRVSVIPHGNEALFAELRAPGVSAASIRAELGLLADQRVVLFIGTLARYKGVDLLIEAFADVARRVPEAVLVIAGYPNADFDLDAHRQLAAHAGVDASTRFVVRYVESEEIAAWMELADVAVLPYREVYQSGAAAIATTFGVPLVASRVGAMPEAIADGETGLLVPPGDVPSLADAVTRLLDDRETARRLGDRAAARARDQFGWNRIAREMLGAYAALPGRADRAGAAPAPLAEPRA